ncbi:hypothetical protein [aff. Roholtiella sp. LEGE 12411]|uniref:hypothetical protein n=1 Tax=aff. Roholtiella sp. LEGE 12411 TaxID=1828822 RepID=UPI0030D97E84
MPNAQSLLLNCAIALCSTVNNCLSKINMLILDQPLHFKRNPKNECKLAESKLES